MTKYQNWYDSIILKRKENIINGVSEKHHIIPKCLGGTDDIHNIVKVAPREHFILHLLLTKIHPSNTSICFAFAMMMVKSENHNRYISKFYEARKLNYYSKPRSIEHKKNIGKAHKGRSPSLNTLEAASKVNKNRIRTPEEKQKRSESLKRFYANITPERLKELYASRTGVPMSEENKQKRRKPNKLCHHTS